MKKQIQLRFYEELNDFLPKGKKKQVISYPFFGNPTVKDSIEACGIPHPEIELIIVNGKSVGFDYHLKDGDRISVYPVFESFDIAPLVRLRDQPLREIKFIIDVNLGKLSRFLRMLGFDVLYDNRYDDHKIVRISSKDRRIILTRDQNLLKHGSITHGYWLRNSDPNKQLLEILNRFDLQSLISPFTRCMDCNGVLHSVQKEDIVAEIPLKTAKYYSEFYRCPSCKKIYWPGSHYQKMKKKIDRIRGEFPD